MPHKNADLQILYLAQNNAYNLRNDSLLTIKKLQASCISNQAILNWHITNLQLILFKLQLILFDLQLILCNLLMILCICSILGISWSLMRCFMIRHHRFGRHLFTGNVIGTCVLTCTGPFFGTATSCGVDKALLL